MKIIGIGVDIVKNKRISLAVKKKSFINRIFGKNEISMSKKVDNRINYFSKRFAAKEALAKALGTGFRDGLSFKDVEIINNKQGMPYYIISSKINNLIKKKKKVKNFNLFLSISDEKEYSVAFTIIQTKS